MLSTTSAGNIIALMLFLSMSMSHLEADTRVMFHAKHADLHDPGNIIVRANDADVCIILTTNGKFSLMV